MTIVTDDKISKDGAHVVTRKAYLIHNFIDFSLWLSFIDDVLKSIQKLVTIKKYK